MQIRQIISGCAVAALLSIPCFAAGSDVADAALNKNKPVLRELLKQKADVNAAQSDGTRAIHWAVRAFDLEMVDMLVAAGADVKVANRDGATPLSLACQNGDADMIEKLVKAGADVNEPFFTGGQTALMTAARTGKVDAVKVLLDHGAKVDARDTIRETTALMWAAEQNHADAIRLLVSKGADVNGHSKISEAKKRYGVNYAQNEKAHTGGMTALVLATREDALEAVKALLELKADINEQTGDGSTAMIVAIQNGHYDVANYLLDHGANVNLVNEKGWNPLYLAIKHRNVETGTIPVPNQEKAMPFIKRLLDAGADTNLRVKANTEIRNGQRATWLAEDGATPFLRAALCGDVEVMRLLLAKGADPSIATKDGTTPLMAAAGVGYSDGFIHDRSEEETIDAMKLILDLGADVNAKNAQGLTALHGAAHKAALKEIQLLADCGGDLAARDNGSKAFGANTEGLLPLNWAEGVVVGVQSAIYHADAVELIEKLMREKGVPIPLINRTLGGNAVAKKQ